MKKLSPLQTIKKFCRECNGEKSKSQHYDCLEHDCILYPYKEGKGIYESYTEQYVTQEHRDYLEKHGTGVRKARVLNSEQRKKASERLKKYHENKQSDEN